MLIHKIITRNQRTHTDKINNNICLGHYCLDWIFISWVVFHWNNLHNIRRSPNLKQMKTNSADILTQLITFTGYRHLLLHLSQITHQFEMTMRVLRTSERNQHLRTHLSWEMYNMSMWIINPTFSPNQL